MIRIVTICSSSVGFVKSPNFEWCWNVKAGQAGATLYRNWHLGILRASRATHDTKHEKQQNKVAQGNGEPCGAEEVLEKLRSSPTTRLLGHPCQLPPYDLDEIDYEKHFRSSLMPLQ
jgi:hypothetical protein